MPAGSYGMVGPLRCCRLRDSRHYDRRVSLLPAARRVPWIVPVALVWALAGCGHTERVGADRTLRVALSEYRLNPQRATASAGELTIVARNYGRLTHNLVVFRDGRSQGATKPLAPGQTGVLKLVLTPARYQLASTILSDQALGEYGTLAVTR
jgi:hypothetical protein